MAIKMIRPDTIAFKATVTEDEIRERMVKEVLEAIGGLDGEGKPLTGIRTTVRRHSGHKGGYDIEITGPMPARILLPGAGGE